MATFYIDPDTGTGTGVGSEADPFAAWSEVTFVAGNSYLQKRGTITTERINLGGLNTPTSRLYVGAYGIGAKPRVDVVAETYCILGNQRDYITVEDFDVSGGTTGGIAFLCGSTRSCTSVHIRRCTATNCNGSGIGIVSSPNQTSYLEGTDQIIEDCEAHNCGGHGVFISGASDGARMSRCKASNCSSLSSGWGTYFSPRGTKMNTNSWTAVGDGSFNLLDWTTFGPLGTNETLLIETLACTQRTSTGKFILTRGTFGSLAADEWDVSGTTLQIRMLTDESPNGLNVIANVTRNQHAIMEHCETWSMSNAFDGHGMGFDHIQETSIMRSCKSWNNPTAGVNFNSTIGCTIESTICYGNQDGIAMTTSHDIYPNNVYNCICDGNSRYGIYFQRSLLANVKNNILINNGTGLDISIESTGVTNSYNNSFGNTAIGNTDATDILLDPALDSDYKASVSSFLYHAGTGVGFNLKDFKGHKFNIPPTIGAYEFTSGSAALDREVA